MLGHERLVRLLVDSQIDRPRLRFLEQDRGGLQRFAKAIEDIQFAGRIRTVRPGTIMFPQQPIADITGKFGLTQAQEIKFEHAFDLPMTTAGVALQFRMAAGSRWLSDFSLRRNGDIERAVDIATYAFIGGFNDTSNMEAAHRLDIPAVGTEAHYWQQAYLEYLYEPEIETRTGQPKHFEQVAFERWLDANPNGTTLLLDTIDVYMGAVHAAMAATSSEARRKAFKGFRVDSGDLAELGKWCLRFFEANGLHGLMPILTGDLDVEKLQRIVEEFPQATGFGVGTKLSSEVSRIAGVIFKQQAETTWRSPYVIAAAMIGIGLVMWWAEFSGLRQKDIGHVSATDALAIGVAQALAVVPGTSRSGVTIAAGLLRNLDRPTAARFSFLLSTPAIAAAAGKDFWDLMKHQGGIPPEMRTAFLAGIAVSAITGCLAIGFFLHFLRRRSLKFFIYYRIVFGIIVIALATFFRYSGG